MPPVWLARVQATLAHPQMQQPWQRFSALVAVAVQVAECQPMAAAPSLAPVAECPPTEDTGEAR